MKTFISGLMSLFLLVVVDVSLAAAKQPEPLVVDLKQPLPTHLTLYENQVIVFENESAKVTAVDTDGNGTLFERRPHNTLNQTAAFRAKRRGSGEITVTLQAQGQLTVVNKQTIRIDVTFPPKGTIKTLGEKDSGQPLTITLDTALEIRLIGKPSTGYTWDIISVTGESVEQFGGLEIVPDPGNKQGGNSEYLLQFNARKPGKTTIKLEYGRSWLRGKEPSAKTFELTVEVK